MNSQITTTPTKEVTVNVPKKSLIIIVVIIVIIMIILIGLLIYSMINKPTCPTCPTISDLEKKIQNTTICPPFSQVPNTNIPGYNLGTSTTTNSQDQCLDKCINTPGCDWYNYTTEGQCFLKQGTPTTGYVTGLKVPNYNAGSMNMNGKPCNQWSRLIDTNVTNISLPAPVNPITNLSESQCQQNCLTNNCDWYTYDQTQSNCYLNNYVNAPGTMTGFENLQS
jgi:hypothetical protein